MTHIGLVGMVHLPPLPGSPRYQHNLPQIISDAQQDAETLIGAGFDRIMVENYGDSPFFAQSVPPITVAAVTHILSRLAQTVDTVWGVNILRNDAEAALSIAAVTGAQMVRVNVWSGQMFTDQGPIVGEAARWARFGQYHCPEVEVWADVMVKHAVPPPGLTLTQLASDTWERGGADALIITGSSTGEPAQTEDYDQVLQAIPGVSLMAGSGVNPANVGDISRYCVGAIVGSSTKIGGNAANPVDPKAAALMVAAAQQTEWYQPQQDQTN